MGGSGVDRTGQAYSLWRVNMTLANQAYLNFDAPVHREILLTQGQVAIVDAADYEWLMQWKWFAHFAPHTQSFYAVCDVIEDGKRKRIYMQRVILGLDSSDPRKPDHKNNMTLDNRRLNLRIATNHENARNARKRKDNTSGLKGVSFDNRGRKWRAYIFLGGRQKSLGYFPSKEEAYSAYCEAAKLHYGEFARLS